MHHNNIDEKLLPTVQKLEDSINDFVTQLFKNHKSSTRNMRNRVVNDSVWGSIHFNSHEIQILDSPLLQRLRDISQLALVSLVYPSARHSRFEHSIGVFHVASEMVNNINKRAGKEKIDKRESCMIRLAALLHDIGHCYYSHISERVYGNMDTFNKLRTLPIFEYKKAKAHEMLAYFMINSKAFKLFFKSLNPDIENYDNDAFYDDIGKMIVGYPIEKIVKEDHKKPQHIKNYFMTDMINGAIDADKLDYIKRDIRFTGLCPDYDLARLLYKIEVSDTFEEGEKIIHRNLSIPITGVTALEEIAFAKIELTSAVYYHHKVLAADALMIDLSTYLMKREIFKCPCDFLKYTEKKFAEERDIFQETIAVDTTKTFSLLIKNISDRKLPKRALEIRRAYIAESLLEKNKQIFDDLLFVEKGNVQEQMKKKDEIRNSIYKISIGILEKIGKQLSANFAFFDKFDIYTSFNNTPSFSSEDIIIYDYNNNNIPLDEIMPLGEWTQAFAANKWSGYIFSREDIIPLVNLAARGYLEHRYGIVFKDETGYSCLKKIDYEKACEIEKKINLQEIVNSFLQ